MVDVFTGVRSVCQNLGVELGLFVGVPGGGRLCGGPTDSSSHGYRFYHFVRGPGGSHMNVGSVDSSVE